MIEEEAVRRAVPDDSPRGFFSSDLVAGRTYLIRLFRDTWGDLPGVMATLQVTQATLYRWFKKLDIEPGAHGG